MNVGSLLSRAGRTYADRPAVAVGADRIFADYGTLLGRVAALAGGLERTFNLAPGDRVALIMRNCAFYIEALFACWHGGWVAVPVNAKLHPREFAFILAHSGARLCLASDDLAGQIEALRPELPDLRAVIAVESGEYRRLIAADPAPIAARAPEDTAWLFYTSGTTGRPKGAMLSHRNLLAMTTSYFVDVDTIAPRDCIIHAAPMSHGSGMYILPHVAAAAKQVIPESGGFEPDELFALIAAHPGASFFAAPTMVRRLVESPAAASADTGNLKTIVYGGAPMYAADCKRAMAVLGNKLRADLWPGREPDDHHRAQQGAPCRDRPSTLRTPAGLGGHRAHRGRGRGRRPRRSPAAVRRDRRGAGARRDGDDRILARSEASARTLRGGWLHTGDVGALDEDGFLTLKDRSKDLIISGGSNIYPREVEEVLLQHPACRGVGGRRTGSRLGRDRRRLRRRGGRRCCGAGCPRRAVPRSSRPLQAAEALRVRRCLPKNNYGKVLKTELRAQLAREKES